MGRAIISGGAGFIGFHLATSLQRSGAEVWILDNFSRSEEDDEFRALREASNVHFVQSDITSAEGLAKLPTDFSVFYHLAAINGTGNFYRFPDKVLRVGVLGALNVLEWYSKHPAGRLLIASSSEVYAGAFRLLGAQFPLPTPEDVPLVVDDPKNLRWSYGAGKILSEVASYAYAQARGFDDFSLVRFHNVYGPRMGFEHVVPQFIERLLRGKSPFTIFGGEETRTFCYVSDAVKALRQIAEAKDARGEIIHVGRDDEEISIVSLARLLLEVAGVEREIELKEAPAGCVKRRCPDISKLRGLGYQPSVKLRQGLELCYRWYHDYFKKMGLP